jgi:hypothetical protein
MKKLLFLLSIVIAGCGGGGSETTPTAPITPVALAIPVENVALFSNKAIDMPDLKSYQMCGDKTITRIWVIADLNNDGRKDMLLQLSCMQAVTGLLVNTDVPNKLLALLQQKDGSFIEGTKSIFGVDYVDAGGLISRAVVNDFNNDKYPDIILAVCREDGRNLSPDASNHFAQNVFLTSNGKGGYNVIKQGQYTWNVGAQLIDNELGGKDLIMSPALGLPEIWRYMTSWVLTNTPDWIYSVTPLFFKRKSANLGSEILVAGVPYPQIGYTLYYNENGNWNKKDTITYPPEGNSKMVPWTTWQGYVTQAPLITINGNDYAWVDINEVKCELKLKKDDTNSVMVSIAMGSQITGGYKGGMLVEGFGMIPTATLMAFNVNNGKITQNTTFKVNNEFKTNVNLANTLTCGDVNGDGYDDIIVYVNNPEQAPVIYINDKTGNFNRVDPALFPGVNTWTQHQTSFYEDIDGDGVRDLLYLPTNGVVEKEPTKLLYFRGNRAILDKDLLK